MSGNLALTIRANRKSFAKSNGELARRPILIHFLDLKEKRECAVCHYPKGSVKALAGVAKEELEDRAEMLIWCIACDRVFHLSCSNAKFEYEDTDLPWLCKECSTETNDSPDTTPAAIFALSDESKRPLKERYVTLHQDVPQLSDVKHSSRCALYKYLGIKYSISGNLARGDVEQLLISWYKQKQELIEDKSDLLKTIEAQCDEIEELKARVASLQPPSTWEESSIPMSTHVVRHDMQQTAPRSKVTMKDLINETLYGKPLSKGSTVGAGLAENGLSPTCDSEISGANLISQITLRDIRASLPKIEKFNGEPIKWLIFEDAVTRNICEGRYEGPLAKHLIRNSLEGAALERVFGMFQNAQYTYQDILAILRTSFGNGRLILDAHRQKILEVKLKPLTHNRVIKATTVIMTYISACRQAGVDFKDQKLSEHIHNQLDDHTKREYNRFYAQNYPNRVRVETLDAQLAFLDEIASTLPFEYITDSKKDSFQLTTISTDESNHKRHNNAKFSKTVRNNAASGANDPFKMLNYKIDQLKGYKWEKVRPLMKKCYACNSTRHYTPQCEEYKNLSKQFRKRLIDSKNLCALCLITDEHSAKQCDIRVGCGQMDGSIQCSAKHHPSIHMDANDNKSYYKAKVRHSSSLNTAQTKTKPPNAQQEHGTSCAASTSSGNPPASQSNQYKGPTVQALAISNAGRAEVHEPAHYQIITRNKDDSNSQTYTVLTQSVAQKSSATTIKLFRVFVRNAEKEALTFAVGDSAAEVTIIRAQLARDLGLKGKPTSVNLHWTSQEVISVSASLVDIKIRGIIPGSKEFEIRDCLAVEDFKLPLRSLNVDDLKRKHKYLRDIPFASYFDVAPQILIGTRDASLLEAQQSAKHGGPGTPVAVKTLLGYTIYGGDTENTSQLLSVAITKADEDSRFEVTQINTHSNAIKSSHNEPENSEDHSPSNKELSVQLEYGFSMDSLGIRAVKIHHTDDEKSALAQAKAGIKRLENGFIQMPLIWRLQDGKIPQLPNNFPMVLKRQLAQERKLKKNPELLKAFNDNFRQLIDDGYVRAATYREMKMTHNVNYIPMSLVVNHNKVPIKTRNVYDASAKYRNTSLNDNLLQGPNLLIDMLAPLMQMRENKVAFTGDIKSMFHRIRIDTRDVHAQRILWRESQEEDMQVFVQMSMLFGANSSPFCSQFAKNWAANHFKDKYPSAATLIIALMYMDDLLASARSAQEAITLIKQCIEILAHFKMDLVGFQSNSTEVLNSIPHSHVKKEAIPLAFGNEEAYKTRVLGVNWQPIPDVFIFDIAMSAIENFTRDPGKHPTKREICSFLARMFDILGLITLCTIRGKIILQRAWELGIEWDEPINKELNKQWQKWLLDLQTIVKTSIPRQRFKTLDAMSDAEAIELHVFADAGKDAYASVAYLVAVHQGQRNVSFALSRAKVTPIKLKNKNKITEMPRLELLACLISARIAHTLLKIHKLYRIKLFCWTDSEICLKWLWNANIKLPRFAISPIDEILEITDRNQWKHVPSSLNVADLATKFQKINFSDAHSVWHTGPKFLTMNSSEWPQQSLQERQATTVLAAQLVQKENNKNNLEDTKVFHENPFSILKPVLPNENCSVCPANIIEKILAKEASISGSWSKIVRATARALKIYFNALIPLLRSKKWRDKRTRKEIRSKADLHTLTPEDIERAELFIIRYMQILAYSDERGQLRDGKTIKNKEFIQLNCFLDHDGVIRINSRIDLPYTEYPQKWAPLVPRLPGKHSLTMMLMQHYHLRYRHISLEAQISDFRTKFWMTAIREWLKSCNYNCNHCYLKRQGALQKNIISQGALPRERVDLANYKPFEVVGLDCSGPFLVYNNKETQKVWILLMTCTITRFVCCYVIDKMDSGTVINAISNLVSHHGAVNLILSDHGTNFLGAANRIQKEQRLIENAMKSCTSALNEYNIKYHKNIVWKFLPVQAAWYGGFYERLIKEVKRSIREEFSFQTVERSEFELAISEATHRLNKRPLTNNTIDANEEEPLTPYHLAINRAGGESLPSVHGMKVRQNVTEKRDESKDIYRKAQVRADRIQTRFLKQYLPELTLRTKLVKQFRETISQGDLILLFELNNARRPYYKGRVIKIYPSRDRKARVADVLMADGSVKKRRSMHHMVKLVFKKL